MPFQAMVLDGVLTSDDLDFLQDIYDQATGGFINIDDAVMHTIVEADPALPCWREGQRSTGRISAG
jgi:hypothetical protein